MWESKLTREMQKGSVENPLRFMIINLVTAVGSVLFVQHVKLDRIRVLQVVPGIRNICKRMIVIDYEI